MPSGLYIHLDAATLATMKTNLIAAHASVLTTGQSYSIAGRTFTRADLGKISQELAEVSFAQGIQGGTVVTETYVDMSNSPG